MKIAPRRTAMSRRARPRWRRSRRAGGGSSSKIGREVRFREQTGKQTLVLSLTASDPERLEAWYHPSYIGRRKFLATLGGAAAAWPLAARAQQPERMRRIGVVVALAEDDPESVARRAAFEQALQASGWTVGRNIRIEYRWAAFDTARTQKLAAEVAALAPD